MRLISSPDKTSIITPTDIAKNVRLITANEYTGSEIDVIKRHIETAWEDAEDYTGRQFGEYIYETSFSAWSGQLFVGLEATGVKSLIVKTADSIVTISSNNYSFAGGYLILNSQFQRLALLPVDDAISVQFSMGINPIPARARTAIILFASHLFQNREASSPLKIRSVPLGYQWLLDRLRVVSC